MVHLEYGPKGQPIINLGEHGNLIFSSLTLTEKGYKYFAYIHRYVEHLVTKNNTTGKRSIKSENGLDSYVFDLKFKRNGGKHGVPVGTIPRKLINKLSYIINQLLVDEIYMPVDRIPALGDAINSVDWEKLLRKPKKRKRKSKFTKESI